MNRGARRQISQTLRPLHVRRANEPQAYTIYPKEEIKDPQQEKPEFIVFPEGYETEGHYL